MMDEMDCKDPTRCRTCVHFDRGACALEADLLAALEGMDARRRAPAAAPAAQVALLWRAPASA